MALHDNLQACINNCSGQSNNPECEKNYFEENYQGNVNDIRTIILDSVYTMTSPDDNFGEILLLNNERDLVATYVESGADNWTLRGVSSQQLGTVTAGFLSSESNQPIRVFIYSSELQQISEVVVGYGQDKCNGSDCFSQTGTPTFRKASSNSWPTCGGGPYLDDSPPHTLLDIRGCKTEPNTGNDDGACNYICESSLVKDNYVCRYSYSIMNQNVNNANNCDENKTKYCSDLDGDGLGCNVSGQRTWVCDNHSNYDSEPAPPEGYITNCTETGASCNCNSETSFLDNCSGQECMLNSTRYCLDDNPPDGMNQCNGIFPHGKTGMCGGCNYYDDGVGGNGYYYEDNSCVGCMDNSSCNEITATISCDNGTNNGGYPNGTNQDNCCNYTPTSPDGLSENENILVGSQPYSGNVARIKVDFNRTQCYKNGGQLAYCDGFDSEISINGTSGWNNCTNSFSGGTGTATCSNLIQNQDYYFRVRAQNSSCDSGNRWGNYSETLGPIKTKKAGCMDNSTQTTHTQTSDIYYTGGCNYDSEANVESGNCTYPTSYWWDGGDNDGNGCEVINGQLESYNQSNGLSGQRYSHSDDPKLSCNVPGSSWVTEGGDTLCECAANFYDNCGDCGGDNTSCCSDEGVAQSDCSNESDPCDCRCNVGHCGTDSDGLVAPNYNPNYIWDFQNDCGYDVDSCGVCNGDGQSCKGCTDINASNYGSDCGDGYPCTIDDGSCEYTIYGTGSAVLGVNGGTIQMASGQLIIIEPNILSGDTTFNLNYTEDILPYSPPLPEGVEIDFEWEITTNPQLTDGEIITICTPTENPQNPKFIKKENNSIGWEEINQIIDVGVLNSHCTTVNSFSIFSFVDNYIEGGIVYGCMDGETPATNYDALATVEYDSSVCENDYTDILCCNYLDGTCPSMQIPEVSPIYIRGGISNQTGLTLPGTGIHLEALLTGSFYEDSSGTTPKNWSIGDECVVQVGNTAIPTYVKPDGDWNFPTDKFVENGMGITFKNQENGWIIWNTSLIEEET